MKWFATVAVRGAALVVAVLIPALPRSWAATAAPLPRAPITPVTGLRLRPMVPEFPREVIFDLERLLAPDIVIKEVQFSPTIYVPPQEVGMRVVVGNEGEQESPPFHVRWRPYATHPGIVQRVSSLGHGEESELEFGFRYTSKTEETYVAADCYDEVAERNESNNEAQAHPRLGAVAWDFYVEDIWLVRPDALSVPITNPVGGEDIEVAYQVGFVNTASSEELAVRAHVYVDGAEYSSFPFHLPPNSTRATHFRVNLPAGAHTIRVAATPPEEMNVANNELIEIIVWRTRPRSPYRFEYYAINRYHLIGGGGDLEWSINEGRRFYWKMDERGHTCPYAAEDDGVQPLDWAYGNRARANWADIVYYAGHGDVNGPWYSSRAFESGALQMQPSNYRWGRNEAGEPTLRWAVWSACSTLYDDVQDSSRVNWWDPPNPLSRWFQTYEGLHGVLGNRSLGWQGEWLQYESGWWYWHDTRDRADKFVRMLHDGYTFNNAWFLANRQTVYDRIDEGFEAAALWAHAEGNDYAAETLTAPYPDYVGTPGGFTYHWYRIGRPTY